MKYDFAEIRLNAMKRAMRETTHTVKPMIAVDKKKQQNKMACRNFKAEQQ